EPILGESIDDANANLEALAELWNRLLQDGRSGDVKLSRLPLSEQPTLNELEALSKRRKEELYWFVRGIGVGQEAAEFGIEGRIFLQRLTEASAFLDAFLELLSRAARSKPQTVNTARSLEQLTRAIEASMHGLSSLGAKIRKQRDAANRRHSRARL